MTFTASQIVLVRHPHSLWSSFDLTSYGVCICERSPAFFKEKFCLLRYNVVQPGESQPITQGSHENVSYTEEKKVLEVSLWDKGLFLVHGHHYWVFSCSRSYFLIEPEGSWFITKSLQDYINSCRKLVTCALMATEWPSIYMTGPLL
jgi:hypothetical protein